MCGSYVLISHPSAAKFSTLKGRLHLVRGPMQDVPKRNTK